MGAYPQHFHLLLRTGKVSIATVMRRLLTGHAGYFNKRHRRSGHLFQNRYKSILCQEDTYLLELVRYIHLNPLRAGPIKKFDRLKKYPYCGHSAMISKGYNLKMIADCVSSVMDLGSCPIMAS